MAKTNQGILGPIIGKIGPVSGHMRDNKNILRPSSSNVNFKYTDPRIAQQQRMKICNRTPIQFYRANRTDVQMRCS